MPGLGRQRHPAFFIPKKYHEEYDRVIILARIGKPVYKKVFMDVDDEYEGDAEEADQGLPTDGRVEDADDEDGGGGNDEGWEDTERSDYEPDLKRRKLTARRKGLRSQSRRPGAPSTKGSDKDKGKMRGDDPPLSSLGIMRRGKRDVRAARDSSSSPERDQSVGTRRRKETNQARIDFMSSMVAFKQAAQSRMYSYIA